MSAQSIVKRDVNDICEKIDKFLICEGNYFRNIVDYDINGSLDYKKLDLIILLKNMMERANDCEKVIVAIDRILI